MAAIHLFKFFFFAIWHSFSAIVFIHLHVNWETADIFGLYTVGAKVRGQNVPLIPTSMGQGQDYFDEMFRDLTRETLYTAPPSPPPQKQQRSKSSMEKFQSSVYHDYNTATSRWGSQVMWQSHDLCVDCVINKLFNILLSLDLEKLVSLRTKILFYNRLLHANCNAELYYFWVIISFYIHVYNWILMKMDVDFCLWECLNFIPCHSLFLASYYISTYFLHKI